MVRCVLDSCDIYFVRTSLSEMAPPLDGLLDSLSSAKSIVELKLIISGLIHNIKETNANCKRKSQGLLDKITELRQEKVELQKTVDDQKTTISDLQAKVSAADDERKQLSSQIADTPNDNLENSPAEIQELHNAVDSTNQYARRGAFTLAGKDGEIPIFSENESSKLIVIDKIHSHTGIKLEETDISIAHRLGRKPESTEDRRPIRFRLVRRDLGPLIVSACKDRRPPIFVNPSLTPLRAKIFHELRKLKSEHGQIIKSCRATLNGEIEAYCRDSAGSTRRNGLKKHVLITKQQLDEFSADIRGAAAAVSPSTPLTGSNNTPLSPRSV